MSKAMHPDLMRAARDLHALANAEGYRSISIEVACDGQIELRAENVRGFHTWTDRADINDSKIPKGSP